MLFAIPFPDISPVLVEIPLGFTSLPIRWYALAYIVGIYLGYVLVRRAIAQPELWKDNLPPLDRDQLDAFLTWIILGIILGGRIGYVLFYSQGQFLEDPLAIIRIWEGGMAFHGGFLGVVAAGLLFCWKNNIPMVKLADALALGTPPGLLLGRIANFINGELWGRPTEAPWGVIQTTLPRNASIGGGWWRRPGEHAIVRCDRPPSSRRPVCANSPPGA